MESPAPRIRIDLTEEQRKQLKELSGKDVPALEFAAEELEARIAPTSFSFGHVEYTYTPQ